MELRRRLEHATWKKDTLAQRAPLKMTDADHHRRYLHSFHIKYDLIPYLQAGRCGSIIIIRHMDHVPGRMDRWPQFSCNQLLRWPQGIAVGDSGIIISSAPDTIIPLRYALDGSIPYPNYRHIVHQLHLHLRRQLSHSCNL